MIHDSSAVPRLIVSNFNDWRHIIIGESNIDLSLIILVCCLVVDFCDDGLEFWGDGLFGGEVVVACGDGDAAVGA